MKPKDYFVLFLLQLVVLLVVAAVQTTPGYMDADYYYAGAMNLVEGRGLSDPFLWNYLDQPDVLPHPSHTYWMPLPSLIGAGSMLLSTRWDFWGARILFLLLASLTAPLSAMLGFRFSQKRWGGWISGLLAVFSGYYLVYLGLVETIALSMLLGFWLLWLLSKAEYRLRHFFWLGLVVGLLHLTRADGVVWLFFCASVVGFTYRRRGEKNRRFLLRGALIFIAGYFAVMGVWYTRNIQLFGWFFPPGAGRAVWITEYDQLFALTMDTLKFSNWIQFGIGGLITQRLDALVANFQTMLAVQGGIILMPLALVGGWQLRREVMIRNGFGAWIVIVTVMTLAFPLAGSRGGYLHSGALVQILVWGLCPVGLAAFIRLAMRYRPWKMERALTGFGILLIFVMVILTIGVTLLRLGGAEGGWNRSAHYYQAVDAWLINHGVGNDAVVLVNNPPGYYIVTHRKAVVIPNGGELELATAAEKFGADYLILEENTVKGLVNLYLNPQDTSSLFYLTSVGEIHIFEIIR